VDSHLPLWIMALILPLVPTFWAILDIPRRRFATPRRKVIWLFLVSTFPLIGAIIYACFVRPRTRPLEARQF